MGSIDLKKKIFNKDNYKKVIDTEFTTFVKLSENTPVTVEEFFLSYEDLYFSIPVEGDRQSHQYLVRRSSELFNFERTTEDIEPLLDEIAKLRERLLTANKRINELRIQLLESQLIPVVEQQDEVISTSTDSQTTIVGCMDPSATNYNPDATEPCVRCCQYRRDNDNRRPNTSTDREQPGGRSTGTQRNTSFDPSNLRTR